MLAPVGAAVSSTAGGSSTTPSGVTQGVASSNRHIAPNATTTFLLLTVLPLISTSCFDYSSYYTNGCRAETPETTAKVARQRTPGSPCVPSLHHELTILLLFLVLTTWSVGVPAVGDLSAPRHVIVEAVRARRQGPYVR